MDLNREQRERSDNTQSCSSVLLLIRFFTQKSEQFFRDTRTEFQRIMKGSDNTADEEEVYHSSDYRRLVGLVSHRYRALIDFLNHRYTFTSSKMDLLSQCWQICLALFLLKCLSYSGWLSSPLRDSQLTEEQLHLVSLAVHMRGVTNYNTHQVGKMMVVKGNLDSGLSLKSQNQK